MDEKPRKPNPRKPDGTQETIENPQDTQPRKQRKRKGSDSGQPSRSKKKREQQSRVSPATEPQEGSTRPATTQDPSGLSPKEASKLPIDVLPATPTGFKELKIGSAFLITLLWLPRFFIPWITAWHEFNVYISSNPYHWEPRQHDLDSHELYGFACSCLVAILSAIVYEKFKEKFDLKYHLYILLLIIFTLSPVAGGLVDVLLRAAFTDNHLYTEWWFSGVVAMRWVMGVSFAMFPTQFACIYAQNNNMSRNAHYNWTSIFVFFEFLNAYVAFWAIPPKCPTWQWEQIVVWGGIGILLITVTMMFFIFFFAVPTLKYVMLYSINYFRKKKVKAEDTPEVDPFVPVTPDLRNRKLMWCSMMLLPLVLSYFSFAVLQRFVPDEDWDKHYLWSATSMFFMGRMIGVVVIVLVMFGLRKGLETYPKVSAWRAEMFYMGVPHVLSILAFLTLFGRFATLSHLSEGGIIFGPIPDDEKTVLLMFNAMFRNRTICISSEYFRPVKIRPLHHATRELYDIGVESFIVNVTVDPCSDLRLQSQFVVENFTKGDWVVYGMFLRPTNLTNEYVWDYYSRIKPVKLLDVERLRPKGVPQIAVFSLRKSYPRSAWYHEFNHSSHLTVHITVANTYDPLANETIDEFTEPRKPVIFDVPAIGTWTATTLSYFHNMTPSAAAWYANATYLRNIDEFEVENYSLYYLVEYYYHEAEEHSASYTNTRFKRQADDDFVIPDYKYLGDPEGFKLFKVAEIAGPNSERLPGKRELQQDWAIKVGLTLAGMAAGGLFHGFVYLFWLDPPIPSYRTTTLAVCWVLMGGAAEIPKIKLVDITVGVSLVLMIAHVAATALHFTGAYFMYTPAMNSRKRAD